MKAVRSAAEAGMRSRSSILQESQNWVKRRRPAHRLINWQGQGNCGPCGKLCQREPKGVSTRDGIVAAEHKVWPMPANGLQRRLVGRGD